MKNHRRKPLRFTHVHLDNWRNFPQVDVDLQQRVFLIGPNASGKSNFLDVFRFLHDIARVGGGFQAAVNRPWRESVAKLKCLAGRHHADVGISVSIGDERAATRWEYALGFKYGDSGQPVITSEKVVKSNRELLHRPNEEDRKDKIRLSQSYLQQASRNENFRELAEAFASVKYLHLVPQAVRSQLYSVDSSDAFGGNILRQMAALSKEERDNRLRLIRDTLRAAVPQLQDLEFWQDRPEDMPHLRARYEHLAGTWQTEEQFSDGTLRLIGLVWALLDGAGPLLLEEPELSVHSGIVRYLPYLFYRLQQRSGRQVLISTHTAELLRDEGIGLNEVLLLQPGTEGTAIHSAGDLKEVKALVEAGIDLGEATFPRTRPATAQNLALVGG